MLHAGDRVAMDWDTYESLGPDVPGEYVDGEFVVSPSPTQRHQQIVLSLAVRVLQVLPAGVRVLQEWSWKPGDDEFVPDLIVFDETSDQERFGGQPHLCVEVLSSDPARDTIRKFSKYAFAGLPHYWIIDPESPTIITYVLSDGTYREAGRHEAGTPVTIEFGVSSITLDPGDLV